MTTAIRLYRTYILSTFVPLNTIRMVSRIFSFGAADHGAALIYEVTLINFSAKCREVALDDAFIAG